MQITVGSLFDGIGGWCIAAERSGAVPVWSSEIEPFCMEVTKKHFPNVMQLGDIRKIKGDKIPPVDIICAGSPCQDLSVAGKREGLKGERSGLFKTANDGTVQTLNNRMGTGGNQVPFIYTFNRDASIKNNMPIYEDKTSTLKPSTRLAVAYAIDCRNSRLSQISMTLQAKNQGGYSLNYQNPIIVKDYVRRLTPLECERLQGLPDNWTEGGSDTARYRAIGNGMAQPCADYVMSKVVKDIKEET